MREVPREWIDGILGDWIEPRGEKIMPRDNHSLPFIGMDNVEAHTTRILGTVHAGTMKSSAAHFYPGDVLYGRLRPYLNKVVRPDFEGMASAEFIVFPSGKMLTSSFLKYRLNSADFVSFANHLNEGDRPRVSFDQINKFYFPLPHPKEQEHIVEVLEELLSDLDNAIENLKTAQEQIRTFRQAVLKQAFIGKLTEKWRCNYKIVVNDRTHFPEVISEGLGDLPTLPNEWFYTYLSKMGDLGRGKSKHRPRNDPKLFGGKYPFIQTGEIRASKNVLREYSETYNDVGLTQSKLWPVGTLCITIAANIAETTFLGIEACFPDSVVGYTAYESMVSPKFVDYFIQSTKQKIQAYAPATAQKNINLTILENLLIPYCHLEEQKQIVQEIESRFSVCDQLDQTIETNLQKAESLRQSILKQAFEGKLTERWRKEHKDLISGKNSAEVLLKKIMDEKADLNGKAKRIKNYD